jgi:CheY-like chemotaxis protein
MSRLWILVVDDQEPVRDLIADILVAEGHDVRTAENGVDALRLLGEQEYDVILSDMMMPEMDGQQLYGEIARRWPHIVTRMVFVTAQAEEPSIADFLGRSGTRVVEKPFSMAELRTALEHVQGPSPA